MRARADDRVARRQRRDRDRGQHENPARSGVSETVTLCKVMLPVLVAVSV